MSPRFTLRSKQMYKVMSLHVEAEMKWFPPLSDGLINDGLPEVWSYLKQMRFNSSTLCMHVWFTWSWR